MNSSIEKLIQSFSKFPTIGPRVAARFVHYLIKVKDDEFNEFVLRLKELRKNVKVCSFCFNVFEPYSDERLCPLCNNKTRKKDTICVVEKESDLEAIERTKKYKGLYFILGGVLSLSKKNRDEIRMDKLLERIEKLKSIKEVIIATNFTTEGEATSLYIERKIKNFNPEIKTTRLSRGMPVGGELEYADPETIENSLLKRS